MKNSTKILLSILVSLSLYACFSQSSLVISETDDYIVPVPVIYQDSDIKSVYFEQPVQEGNYDVTYCFGDEKERTINWVKAEGRRYMLDRIVTEPGQFISKTFTVNTRTNQLKDGSRVRMRQDEGSFPRWDGRLTLHVMSDHPSKVSVPVIKRNEQAVTIYLAGDSTVTDQKSEPWASWGLMLPAFFRKGYAVANHAESGLSLASFKGDKRQQKVLESLKPGDFILIQFGHNDQKEKGDGVGPFTTYKQRLMSFIDEIRIRKGNPVIIAPMERRRFDSSNKPFRTLLDFRDAAKQAADEKNVPFINLADMSFSMYQVFGKNDSTKLFVYYGSTKDDTHHSVFGGYELAKCVVQGIKEQVPELAKGLRPGIPDFNPEKPDHYDDVKIPASEEISLRKPAGN